MYLEGMSATMDVALRLEEFLHESLVLPVDPFGFLSDHGKDEAPAQRLEGFERELFSRLQRLGYAVLPTARSPFDALSSKATTTLLTGVGDADSGLDRKAEVVSNISRVVEKDSVMFVVRRPVRRSIRGIPVIAREELRRMKDSDDVEEMISERKG
jgi:putative transcriptional regulator